MCNCCCWAKAPRVFGPSFMTVGRCGCPVCCVCYVCVVCRGATGEKGSVMFSFLFRVRWSSLLSHALNAARLLRCLHACGYHSFCRSDTVCRHRASGHSGRRVLRAWCVLCFVRPREARVHPPSFSRRWSGRRVHVGRPIGCSPPVILPQSHHLVFCTCCVRHVMSFDGACVSAESVVRFAYFYKWRTHDARDRQAAAAEGGPAQRDSRRR
jgi:hypothetical protein